MKIGFFFAAALLFADGGTLLFQKHAGSLIVTAFSSPEPVRVGVADLSAMVQKAADRSSVLDARVAFHLQKSDAGKIVEIVVPATRAQSGNKLLYAGHANVPSAGEWRMDVSVTANSETVDAGGSMTVLPEETPLESHWPYFALVPVALILFAMNQWLKSRRKFRRSQARP